MGLLAPTTTPLPDEVIDTYLAQLKESELKVLLFIIRRTLGFGKHQDKISLSQISQGACKRECGTGLSKSAICAAIIVLEGLGLIKSQSGGGRGLASTYSIVWESRPITGPAAIRELSVQQDTFSGETVQIDNRKLSTPVDIQETVLQETEKVSGERFSDQGTFQNFLDRNLRASGKQKVSPKQRNWLERLDGKAVDREQYRAGIVAVLQGRDRPPDQTLGEALSAYCETVERKPYRDRRNVKAAPLTPEERITRDLELMERTKGI